MITTMVVKSGNGNGSWKVTGVMVAIVAVEIIEVAVAITAVVVTIVAIV